MEQRQESQNTVWLILRPIIILLVVTVIVLGGHIFSWSLETPQYVSEAVLLLDNDNMKANLSSDTNHLFLYYQSMIQNQVYIDKVYDVFMEKNHGTLSDKFNKDKYFSEFQKNVRLLSVTGTNLIKLRVCANDPQLAVEMATAAMTVLLERDREIKDKGNKTLLEFLHVQTETAKKELEIAETKASAFKRKTGIRFSEVEGGPVDSLVQLEDQLIRLQSERKIVELVLNASKEGVSLIGIRNADSEIKGQSLDSCKLSNQLTDLVNQEQNVLNLVEQFKIDNPEIKESNSKFIKLSGNQSVAENVYNFLLEKGEEAKIKAATGIGGIRILDMPGLPGYPVKTGILSVFLTGLTRGLGLGFGLALMDFLWQIRKRKKSQKARSKIKD